MTKPFEKWRDKETKELKISNFNSLLKKERIPKIIEENGTSQIFKMHLFRVVKFSVQMELLYCFDYVLKSDFILFHFLVLLCTSIYWWIAC